MDLEGSDERRREVRKGAVSAVAEWVRTTRRRGAADTGQLVDGISASGGTPLMVAEASDGHRSGARHRGVARTSSSRVCGERFDELRGDGHPDGHDHG